MRQFGVCVLVALLLAGASTFTVQEQDNEIDTYIFEGLINDTIEGIRPSIPDPLLIAEFPLDFPPGGIIVGSAKLSNLEVTGLRAFQIPKLSFSIIGDILNFTFVLPSLNINTNYYADLLVADLIPLYGDGKANVHLSGLIIEASAQADISDGIKVSNLRVVLGIQDATFDIHGILNNEDFSLIVSAILNDTIAKFINEHPDLITAVLSPIVEAIINAVLAGGGETTTVAAESFAYAKLS